MTRVFRVLIGIQLMGIGLQNMPGNTALQKAGWFISGLALGAITWRAAGYKVEAALPEAGSTRRDK